ncbi:MAG: MAPEG family protein [Devosiaceae bacterium]
MTPELLVLILAVLLAFVQLILYAIPANLELEPGYTAGPRDGPPSKNLSARTSRTKRAYDNHIETLPWFAIAVLVAHLTGGTDPINTMAAWAYLAARILYVPLYIFGVFALRSIVWAVAFFAILTIVLRTLF